VDDAGDIGCDSDHCDFLSNFWVKRYDEKGEYDENDEKSVGLTFL
jgi:hypothetical protein